jgi:hypothetical protein
MFTHIVLFKLNDPACGQKVHDLLINMKGKIAELREIEVGIDVLKSQRSFDVSLITRFDKREDLDIYQVHPVHIEVLKYIKTVLERSVAVDYES